MRSAFNMLLGAAIIVIAGGASVRAEEKKDDKKTVTLKGTIVCTKCELKETAACGNAIQVKEGDKTVTYYFDDKGKAEDYHKKICTAPGKGSVTGVVSEKD